MCATEPGTAKGELLIENGRVKVRRWPSITGAAVRATTTTNGGEGKRMIKDETVALANLAAVDALGVSACFRCGQPVYPLEKVEPVEGQRYHPQCFRCSVCQTKLSLATFCSGALKDQQEHERDTRLYCRAHQPKPDKVMLCKFSTRKSAFPAFKLMAETAPSPVKGNSSNNRLLLGRNA